MYVFCTWRFGKLQYFYSVGNWNGDSTLYTNIISTDIAKKTLSLDIVCFYQTISRYDLTGHNFCDVWYTLLHNIPRVLLAEALRDEKWNCLNEMKTIYFYSVVNKQKHFSTGKVHITGCPRVSYLIISFTIYLAVEIGVCFSDPVLHDTHVDINCGHWAAKILNVLSVNDEVYLLNCDVQGITNINSTLVYCAMHLYMVFINKADDKMNT